MPLPLMRSSLAVVAAMIACACGVFGPSEPLTGAWQARSAGTIPSIAYLDLRQTGDRITGIACYVQSGGRVLYKSAPVSGTYPNVSYVRRD